MNKINNVLLVLKTGKKVSEAVINPMGGLSTLFMKELYNLTIADIVKKKIKQ